MTDNPSPYEIQPDEHLEARITAYVLGEASPFEAAEIEVLIAKSPELKLFSNRLRTLDTLLKEAETNSNSPHKDWKIPPEKRAAFAPALGNAPIPFPHKENRIRRAVYRVAFGIAAVFLVTLFTKRFVFLPENILKESPTITTYSAMLPETESPQGEIDEILPTEPIHPNDPRFDRGVPMSMPRSAIAESSPAEPATAAESALQIEIAGQLRQAGAIKSKEEMTLDEVASEDEKTSPKKPSAPGSSAAKAIASNKPAPTRIPVPEIASPTATFGDGNDFGSGWSSGGGFAKKEEISERSAEADLGLEVAGKYPAGDVDSFFDTSGILSETRKSAGGIEYEINTGYNSQYLFSRGSDLTKNDKVPKLGATPLVGRLFEEFEKNGKFDLAAMERKLNELKAQIEEPSINDSNKQALFKQWQVLQAEAIRRLRVQTPDNLADLSQEIQATQEPFSTFSLNISDASFQVASSAVAKGERPDPESIKPEQFYNAVSYDDPAPSTGEPVAAAIAQVAHPVIPGRNLVRMSVRTASTGRAATQPLVLTLLVDQSGSMARADRRAAMDTALTQLATLMQPDDRITVIGFSRTPRLLADSLPGDQAKKLPDIINQSSSEGGTNIEQALNLAEDLALRHKIDGAQNRIVLFTDGAANLGNADPERLAERVKSLRQQDLAFDIAGIGTNDINDRLLSELSRHGNGRYYLVDENTAGNLAKQLAGAFRPAAENVKIQVKFNPQRVGNYKLIGFEKDRLKTEDFRNDSVDAAELAADESGTALYQVEPLPDGSGEIGELYVRFRDTATGEMVERSWTIPYESQAPAIDRAQPQMQLAALSLLAAQKLQTGPLADAINFRDLAPTIAAVKQAYARSPEAQQMITLINALK